ncbi:MAG: YqhA family protein [Bacteroidales bacterium]|nr:YqhA family protein [Bacteroidales bacterium]
MATPPLTPQSTQKHQRRNNAIENVMERIIFWSRWLQVPIYLGMVIVMVLYSYVYCKDVFHHILSVNSITEEEMLLIALGVIDVSMIFNLMIVVLIGGYWSFVSRLEVIEDSDDYGQFGYLSNINPNTLKRKLMVSLISISGVHLLETFVRIDTHAVHYIPQIAIHLVFLVSAIGMTIMDRIGKEH